MYQVGAQETAWAQKIMKKTAPSIQMLIGFIQGAMRRAICAAHAGAPRRECAVRNAQLTHRWFVRAGHDGPGGGRSLLVDLLRGMLTAKGAAAAAPSSAARTRIALMNALGQSLDDHGNALAAPMHMGSERAPADPLELVERLSPSGRAGRATGSSAMPEPFGFTFSGA